MTLLPELEQAVDDVIAPEAAVRDTASTELLTVRRKINTLKIALRNDWSILCVPKAVRNICKMPWLPFAMTVMWCR